MIDEQDTSGEEAVAQGSEDSSQGDLGAQVTGSEEPGFASEIREPFDEDVAFLTPEESSGQSFAPRKQELLPFEDALELVAQVEAIIFASPKPVKPADILEVIRGDEEESTLNLAQIESTIQSLQSTYEERSAGFRLEFLPGSGYQFRTIPAAAPLMERLFASRPRPISRAALETLAIIAYRQPTTRAEIEFIRGVDAGSIVKNLLERDLIRCVGRKEDAGRPMLFGTTDEFLKVFRLSSLEDLPPLRAFQPSPETLKREGEAFEEGDSVDVEDFIGDAERKILEFSEGLMPNEDEEVAEDDDPEASLDDEHGTEDQLLAADDQETEGEITEGLISPGESHIDKPQAMVIEGASVEATKVDSEIGDRLETGSREVDREGEASS